MESLTPGSQLDATMFALKSLISDLRATTRDLPSDAELSNLYQTAPVVYRAANKWAAAVSSVPMVAKLHEEALPITHPLQRLFSSRLQYRDMIKRTSVTMDFWGSNLLEKRRNMAGQVFKLDWLNPNTWEKITDSEFGLVGWKLHQAIGARKKIPRHNGVYFNNIDFKDDYEGISPAEVSFMAASVNAEIGQTMLALFRNRAIPAMLIMPAKDGPTLVSKKNEPSPAKRMVALLQQLVKGSKNAGRTIVTPGRWETIQFQQDFNNLPLGELKEDVLVDVAIAFDIPLSLLVSGHATYSGQETDRREWWQGSVKPKCEWYGDIFTEEVASGFGAGYTVEPDFSKVSALKEDEVTRTNVVTTQLTSSIITIQESRVALDKDPDPNLPQEGLYIIAGIPVPASQLAAYNPATAPVDEFAFSATSPATPLLDDKPHPLPPRPQETTNPAPSRSIETEGAFIPRPIWRELENWQRLIGEARGQAFKPIEIPDELASYIRFMLDTSDDTPATFEAAKTHYRESYADLGAKAFTEVARGFQSTLFDLLNSAFKTDAKGQPGLTRKMFGELGRVEISEAVAQVFKDGFSVEDVFGEAYTDEERAYLKAVIKQQRGYFTRYANRVYKAIAIRHEVVALQKRARRFKNEDKKAALISEADEKQQAFLSARNQFIRQIKIWVNKGLREAYEQGRLFAKANQMLVWKRDPRKDSCRTCRALDGQVHRRSSFHRYGFIPGSSDLECWGAECGCTLDPTSDKPRGSLSRVPGGSKSLAGKTEPEQTLYWSQPIHAGEYDDSGAPLGFGFQLFFPSDLALQSIRTQLDTSQNALNAPLQPDSGGAGGVVWVEPNEWHLSLCYSDAEYPVGLANVFKDIPIPTLSGEIVIDRVEVWDTPDDGRVLVLRPSESLSLRQFQENIYYMFSNAGVAPTEFSRPSFWKPHIAMAYNWAGASPQIDAGGILSASQLRLLTAEGTLREWRVEDD